VPFIGYTAITHNYDKLIDPPFDICADVDLVAFVHSSNITMRWEAKHLTNAHKDPCRSAKFYKVLPHRIFPEAQFSLWVDGSLDFVLPFPICNLLDYLANADLAVFAHPVRHCLYEEACECVVKDLDHPDVIYKQIQRYTKEGYPPNLGLVEATAILRRHCTRVNEFNEHWWREIEGGSKRDQLSFNYVAWKQGLNFTYFPGDVGANGRFFRRRPHTGSRAR